MTQHTNDASAVRDRIRAILALPEATKVGDKFAHHLAFETDMSVESAGGVMRALMADMAGDSLPGASTAESYIARKTAAGTLGLGTPEAADSSPAEVTAAWVAAVDQVNGRLGGDAVH